MASGGDVQAERPEEQGNTQFLAQWLSGQQLVPGMEDVPIRPPWKLNFTNVPAKRHTIRACCGDWMLRYLDEQNFPHPLTEWICTEVQSRLEGMDRSTFRFPCYDDDVDPEEVATATDADVQDSEYLDGMKMCGHVLGVTKKVCCEAASGELKIPELPCKWQWTISTMAIRNKRRKMEDRHVVLPYLELASEKKIPPTSLYGIFDGHRSSEAAEFAAAHLPGVLVNNVHFEDDLPTATRESLKEIDTLFLEYANAKNSKAGCTALVVCIRGVTMCGAWLGDSQLLVSRAGHGTEFVTPPHSPSSPSEQARIHDLGGVVLQMGGTWRVSGHLGVARAIGDVDLKKYVTSDAGQFQQEISAEHDYIVLGCDGLWDITEKERLDEMMSAAEQTRDGITNKLCGAAKAMVEVARQETEDNISAIVVDLQGYYEAYTSSV